MHGASIRRDAPNRGKENGEACGAVAARPCRARTRSGAEPAFVKSLDRAADVRVYRCIQMNSPRQ
eukprot:scaffold122178_cov32-Tisochrysis_lutea.AAC.2